MHHFQEPSASSPPPALKVGPLSCTFPLCILAIFSLITAVPSLLNPTQPNRSETLLRIPVSRLIFHLFRLLLSHEIP